MEKTGEDRRGRATQRTTGQAKWTFMVYMAGDNNLDGAALRDIAEMAKAGSTKDVHILVQLDRLEDQKTRRFRITRGGGFKKDCIEAFSETNTGDPQILYSFCQWAADHYPAERYALILWNHGSGWWEEGKGRVAGLPSIQDVIPNSATLSGPPTGPARDVIFSRSDLHDAAPPDHGRALSARLAGPTDPSAVPEVHRKRYRPLFRHPLPREYRSICYDDTSDGDALDNRELHVVLAGICALDLARDRAGVFWYEYGRSRNRLMARIRKGIGGSARHLLKRIRNANGDLAALGAMLYRIQQGAVKLSDPPAKHEWIVIWAAYHDRQAALRP